MKRFALIACGVVLTGCSVSDDPVYVLSMDEQFQAAYATYQAQVTADGYAEYVCPLVVDGSVAPRSIAGSYALPCSYYVTSADGSAGTPCSVEFGLSEQTSLDATTDEIEWVNNKAIVPGASRAYVRDEETRLGIWFKRSDAARADCSVTTINYVMIDPARQFACGFSTRVAGACPGVGTWWSWQGSY